MKKRFGNPSWFPIRDWFDLNVTELTWAALIFGAVFLVGMAVS